MKAPLFANAAIHEPGYTVLSDAMQTSRGTLFIGAVKNLPFCLWRFLQCANVTLSYSPTRMTEFITATEASKLTTVSASTIKRFIHDVIGDDSHHSRDKIQPSEDDLRRAKEAGEPYRWKIEREFAIEQFGKAEEAKHERQVTPSGVVLEILKDQLQSKDEQIRQLQTQLDRKDEQIARQDSLMQKSQMLMQDLQQRLALTPPPTDTVDAKQAASNKDSKKRPLFGGIFQRSK